MPWTNWKSYWGKVLYTSPLALAANGDSGIIATPNVDGAIAIIPVGLMLVGANITTDETLALTIDWYFDAAGTGMSLGTTTFATLNASTLAAREIWPGDITTLYSGTDELCPMPPYMKLSHTVGGTTPSMNYVVYYHYLVMSA